MNSIIGDNFVRNYDSIKHNYDENDDYKDNISDIKNIKHQQRSLSLNFNINRTNYKMLNNYNNNNNRELLKILQFIILIMLLLISSFTSIISAASSSTDSKSDTFNIEKLLEYSELVTCFGQMHKEFEQCNRKGAEKAKSFLGQIELSQEWNRRLKCCGTWKLRDCWMKAAKQKCTKMQADMVYRLPDLIMPALVEECQEYTVESGKCTLPVWLIISVITIILLILTSCCSCLCYCIRRKINNNKYRANGLPPTAKRLSSTSSSIEYNVKNKSYNHNNFYHQNGILMNKINGDNYDNINHNDYKKCNGNSHHGYNHNNHHHHHHHHHKNKEQHQHEQKSIKIETLDCVDNEELTKLNPPPSPKQQPPTKIPSQNDEEIRMNLV